MDYRQLIKTMSLDIYQSLKHSVELGKWPDGKSLTPRQRESSMQAIIAWGEKYLDEKERVGFINKGHKGGDSCGDPHETTLTWKE